MTFEEKFFARAPLSPNQVMSVADRRRDDAVFLMQQQDNRRYNAAVYLYGIAIECALKALLLRREPWLVSAASRSARSRDRQRQKVASLMYRSHDLDEMLDAMPKLKVEMESATIARHFARVKPWSVLIRYSPRQVAREEALDFQTHAEEVFKWLRRR